MKTLTRGIGRIAGIVSLAGAMLAILGMVLIVGLISVEVVLRAAFATSTFVVEEVVGYAVAAIGFLALGHAFREGSLIRVQILVSVLARWPLARQLAEIVALVVALFVVGFLIYYFGANVQRQFARGYGSGSVADIPLWIPTGLMFLGICIFWLQLFANLVQSLAGADPADAGAEGQPLID